MTNYMKKQFLNIPLLSTLFIALVSFSSFTIGFDKANFSGDWKLNESKSDLGEFGGRIAATAIKVEQQSDAITITRTTPGFDGGDPMTNTIKVSFDGKVTESTVFGNSVRKTTAKWSDDQTLVVDNVMNLEFNGETMVIKSVETWTLKDGTLTIVIASSSPRGETTIKTVYTK